MTDAIEIPGYEVFIPNSTWGRRAKPIINCSRTTQILRLTKYRILKKGEIIRFIQKNAELYKSRGNGQKTLEKIPLY